MSLKYIQLDNYIEIVSNIFPKLIQCAISKNSYSLKFIFINLNDKDITDILKYELKKYRKDNEKFGIKILYVNTGNSDKLKYLNNNDHILIDSSKMKKVLDKYWNSIFVKKYDLCFELDNLSSYNIETIITKIIGEQFIDKKDRFFSHLIDDNENKVISNEQINKIGQQLMLKGVCNYVSI